MEGDSSNLISQTYTGSFAGLAGAVAYSLTQHSRHLEYISWFPSIYRCDGIDP